MSRMALTGLKSRGRQGWVPFGDPKGESVLTFSGSWPFPILNSNNDQLSLSSVAHSATHSPVSSSIV